MSFKEQQFVQFMNKFSRDIYQCLSGSLNDETKNILFGSANIYALLSILLAGSKGTSLSELKNVMNIPDKDDDNALPAISAFYKLWKGTLKSNKENLKLANKLWISNDIEVNKKYSNSLKKELFADIEGKDFKAPDEIVADINAWVLEQTHDKIRNFLTPKDITVETKLLATSVVYFNGKWKKPFEGNDTIPMLFFPFGKEPVTVPMMYKKDKFSYVKIDEYDCKVLSLGYIKSSLKMMILLPNQKEGLPVLENVLCSSENDMNRLEIWKEYKLKMTNNIHLYLPKFRLKEKISLNSSLKALGLEHLFVQADFSGISDDKALSSLSNISHTVYLEVDEEGTVATSSCSGDIVKAGEESKEEVEFKVDHPCLFMLYDEDSQMIMFLGRLNEVS